MANDALKEVIDLVANNGSIPPEERVKVLSALQKLSTPLSDPLIYRLVVTFLGSTVVLTIIGGFYLSISAAVTIPEGLIALGSAAVGALAGLLAPSPMTNRQ